MTRILRSNLVAGKPWCPDVRRALPVVRARVAERRGTLLEVCVGQRTAWKDMSHPFRLDPRLKLTGIPTLVRWTADGPAERVGTPNVDTDMDIESPDWLLNPHHRLTLNHSPLDRVCELGLAL